MKNITNLDRLLKLYKNNRLMNNKKTINLENKYKDQNFF
jgi:hypothetical protein